MTNPPIESKTRIDHLNRRQFLTLVAGGAAAALMSPAGCQSQFVRAAKPAAKRPNIIFIMADDLGYECLGCYGSASYKTPVLDELARTGMRFDHCYSQPLCTPSRVKIMTGKSNARNYTKFGHFDFTQKTFAHILKRAGYDTCIVGKWQLMGRGLNGPHDAGFDEYCLWHMEDIHAPKGPRFRDPKIIKNRRLLDGTQGKYGPDIFTDYICDLLQRHKSSNARPFFLYYPMALTHAPFEPTPDSKEWNKTNVKNSTKYFTDMVAYMDKIIGRIVRKLDELGLRENTLLLFTGDNGSPRAITTEMHDGRSVRGGKSLTTDAGTHVALIANFKGTTPAGKVCTDLVDFSDFLPTLADAAGASLPRDVTIDGRSFLPQLKGKSPTPRQWIFCHYNPRPEKTKLIRFARDKRWKLYAPGNHNRAGKLYDVTADPLEQNPVEPGQVGPEASSARKRLQAALNSLK